MSETLTKAEANATATDNVDTEIAIIISGSVDTATVGTYTINYNASDTAGNQAAPMVRTVNVKMFLFSNYLPTQLKYPNT